MSYHQSGVSNNQAMNGIYTNHHDASGIRIFSHIHHHHHYHHRCSSDNSKNDDDDNNNVYENITHPNFFCYLHVPKTKCIQQTDFFYTLQSFSDTLERRVVFWFPISTCFSNLLIKLRNFRLWILKKWNHVIHKLNLPLCVAFACIVSLLVIQHALRIIS